MYCKVQCFEYIFASSSEFEAGSENQKVELKNKSSEQLRKHQSTNAKRRA